MACDTVRRDVAGTPQERPVSRALRSQINVTPLVDASVQLPRSKHAKPPERAPSAWISIRREGRHALARLEGGRGPGRAFSLGDADARAAFCSALAQRIRMPEGTAGPVVLKADADLPNALLDEVLQACRSAGATRAEFITGDESRPGRL
jgi:biopolymer transport protein ExbD